MGKESWPDRFKAVEPILEEKRFHLSSAEFSRDRLRILREEFKKFQREYPGEVIAFSLYGSMSKGYAEEESDIDGALFFDKNAKDAGNLFLEFKRRYPQTIADAITYYIERKPFRKKSTK